MSKWWVLLNSDGTVAQQVHSDGNPVNGDSPQYEWDEALVDEAPRAGRSFEDWDRAAGAWVTDIPRARLFFQAIIDTERNGDLRQGATQAEPRTLAYARKGEEVGRYFQMSAVERAGLNPSDAAAMFPWFSEEASRRSESLDETMTRARDAKAASEDALRTIEAKATSCKAMIAASSDLTEIQAIANGWRSD